MFRGQRKAAKLARNRNRVARQLNLESLEDRRLLTCLPVTDSFIPVDANNQPLANLKHDVEVTSFAQDANGNCVINRAESSGSYDISGEITGPFAPFHDNIQVRLHNPSNEVLSTATVTGSGVTISFTFNNIDAMKFREGENTLHLSMTRTDSTNNPDSFDDLAEFTITFDTMGPSTAPSAPDLNPGSDSNIDTDNVTNSSALEFTINDIPSVAARIELLRGDQEVAFIDDPGSSVLLSDANAPDGLHDYRARIFDGSLNPGPLSDTLRVEVDREKPPAPTEFSLSHTSDSLQPDVGFDFSSNDNTTFDSTPSFLVSDVPGEVQLIVDGAVVQSSITNNLITPTDAFLDGDRLVSIRQVDTAGNESDPTAPLFVSVDTTVGAATLGSPGTPIHNLIYDLNQGAELLGTNTQPWQMTFDKTTQTVWLTAESGQLNGSPALAQFDPATGKLRVFDLSVFGDTATNSHGTFFDFNSQLTPRVWVAHRALGESSTRLSYLDINSEDPSDSELVSYDFSTQSIGGDFIKDLHAVFVDKRGTVWATSLLGDRIIEVRPGDAFTNGGGLDTIEARLIVHDVPSTLLLDADNASQTPTDMEFNAHALEVVVDDRTGETYVYMVAGNGLGRTGLLKPTTTTLLENTDSGNRAANIIRVLNPIEPGTPISINDGSANSELATVVSVSAENGSFLLTLDRDLSQTHRVNEEVRGPDQWVTWDLSDINVGDSGVDVEAARGTFTKVYDNETPGNPLDDQIIVTMPVGIAGGAPSPTLGIVHVIDPSRTLASESLNANAHFQTFVIPRAEDAPAVQQFSATNQPFVDRSGQAFYIDRIASIGRFRPGDLSPSFSDDVRAITDTVHVNESGFNRAVVLNSFDTSPANVFSDFHQITPETSIALDHSPVDGLDQYTLAGRDIPTGRGNGPFRGFLNASNVLYGSLSLDDKLSVTVFAESARRQMSAVASPFGAVGSTHARMAFQVLQDGSLVMTARGDGRITDDQVNLSKLVTSLPSNPFPIAGEANARLDGNSVVVMGRTRDGGAVLFRFTPRGNDWEHDDLFDGENWQATKIDGSAFNGQILAEEIVPAGPLGFSVTTAEGRLLTISLTGQITDLTGNNPAGAVYSGTSTIEIGNNVFIYGTNQTGGVVRYRVGDPAPVILPVPANLDHRLLQNLRTLSTSDGRHHLFGTDGLSRLVHWQLNENGDPVSPENVSEMTAGRGEDRNNFGYFPFQQEFAGRIYTYVAPIEDSSGAIRVYGTNGGDLVELTLPSGGAWRSANLTQDTNATFGNHGLPRLPANAVFGGPTAYVDAHGGRHVLQINGEGEVVEYFTYGNLHSNPDLIRTQNVNFFTGQTPESLSFPAMPNSENILIHASGQTGEEEMQLFIGNQLVESWIVDTTPGVFSFNAPAGTQLDEIKVAFANDSAENGADRNLVVDKIVFFGLEFESESANVFSTGVSKPGEGVRAGFGRGQTLSVNGYFQYDTGTRVMIAARGTMGTESMTLEIGGVQVATFYDLSTASNTYSFPAMGEVTADQVRVVFNDKGADEALTVDFLQLDDTRFEAEDPSVFSLGTSGPGGVTSGFQERETLLSSGFFQFGSLPRSTIIVRAAGRTGEENFDLQIDGQTVKSFRQVQGDPNTRVFQSFSYAAEEQITPDRVRVVFINDQYVSNAGIDRGLSVDHIMIDDVVFESEAPSTYSTGTWLAADGVTAGFRESELLHANGFFQFGLNDLPLVSVQSANVGQNESFPQDVDANGEATAGDALLIINSLPGSEGKDFDGRIFYPNVNGDSQVSALDALAVINHLIRSEERHSLHSPQQAAASDALQIVDRSVPDRIQPNESSSPDLIGEMKQVTYARTSVVPAVHDEDTQPIDDLNLLADDVAAIWQ